MLGLALYSRLESVRGSYRSYCIFENEVLELLRLSVSPYFTVNVLAIVFLSRNNVVSSKSGFLFLANFCLIFPLTEYSIVSKISILIYPIKPYY